MGSSELVNQDRQRLQSLHDRVDMVEEWGHPYREQSCADLHKILDVAFAVHNDAGSCPQAFRAAADLESIVKDRLASWAVAGEPK